MYVSASSVRLWRRAEAGSRGRQTREKSHQVFVERYAFLLPPERMQRLAGSEHTDVCQVILAFFQIKATMFQVRQRQPVLVSLCWNIGRYAVCRTPCCTFWPLSVVSVLLHSGACS